MTEGGGDMGYRLRYVHEDKSRHGQVRVYFQRKGGRKIRLHPELGTDKFLEEYRAALAGVPAARAVRDRRHRTIKAAPGTFGWLCCQYFSSREFLDDLDQSTQRQRRNVLESCVFEPVQPGAPEVFKDFPLDRMTRKAIKVLRDRKSNFPHAADQRVKALRALFDWGLDAEEDYVKVTPVQRIKKIARATDGHHTWTLDEIGRFEERHPIGTKARLALAILCFTGQRKSDMVVLGKQHVRDAEQMSPEIRKIWGGRWLHFTQQKGRLRKPVTLFLPILPELEEVLAASPLGDLTFLVNDYGRAFTAAGMGNKFRDWCDQAGLRHCSAHGLRKAGASLAAENGATDAALMAIFGWTSSKQPTHYRKAARQAVIAGQTMGLLRRTEVA